VLQQIPLRFEFQSNQNFSTFYHGDNEETIDHLQQFCHSSEQQIYLWGAAGTGKTHLLQATTQEVNKQSKSCFYFSFNNRYLTDPSMLAGLESLDIICFDNIDHIAGNKEWEQAFFNFFNLHRDRNKQLILSSSCPPKYLGIELSDLKTRMSWGLTLKIKELSDEQQLNALIYKANSLGFEIPTQVGRYIMNHYASDLPSTWSLLKKIELATLSAKRKISIPFLKQIMSGQEN
jgi:DnaA family protein